MNAEQFIMKDNAIKKSHNILKKLTSKLNLELRSKTDRKHLSCVLIWRKKNGYNNN